MESINEHIEELERKASLREELRRNEDEIKFLGLYLQSDKLFPDLKKLTEEQKQTAEQKNKELYERNKEIVKSLGFDEETEE